MHDASTAYVPFWTAAQQSLFPAALEAARRISEGAFDTLRTMYVFDALVCNTDRHANNFGFLRSNLTGELLGMAPLFDHNLALFPSDMEQDYPSWPRQGSVRRPAGSNLTFDSVARLVMSEKHHEALRGMIDFHFSNHPVYPVPEKRLEALNRYVSQRVRQLLEIDPVDDWLVKTNARRYVIGGASALAAFAVVFALLSVPGLKETQAPEEAASANELTADAAAPAETAPASTAPTSSEPASTPAASTAPEAAETTAESVPAAEEPAPQAAPAASNNTASPGFRGSNSNGISTAKNVPVKWDLAGGSNILWKQPVPKSGHNSPVIVGNNVFFSGADDQARELYCYDLNTGDKYPVSSSVTVRYGAEFVTDYTLTCTSSDTNIVRFESG